ncbi:MAG: PIG-L deacetylase family protein [Acidobacteriota bacterium]
MKRHNLSMILASIVVLTGYIVFSYTSNALPQEAFSRLEEVSVPDRTQRILVFSPHPDDETIAVGGYIYSARQAGAVVHVVLVSDGDKHGLKEVRYQEFRKATAVLGVPPNELEFWGFPDGKINMFSEDLGEKIALEIAVFKPTIIIYPFMADSHPDHADVGHDVDKQLALMGKDAANIKAYGYLVHFSYYPEPSIFERGSDLLPPASLGQEDWGRYYLSDEARQTKKAAVANYKSQLRNPYLRSLFDRMLRSNELLVRRWPSLGGLKV